ncbi:hypothetical protein [Saccharopolyspora sp. NPDC002686]|uniref:hypothetical protein n=1 Tax=Saccharopolyspora sp. NPDC002686 TaxID=3154541 RepID=UPI0033183C39
MSSSLSISVILPEDSAWNQVETKICVDGQDLIGPEFDEGPRLDPEVLLGPDSPLLPEDEPREVMLAEAECTWGCCGAVFVRISRDGDQIVWDEWRNPDSELSLPEIRFDSAQYEAELARADRERSWEWSGWTVARLLTSRLREEPSVLWQWDSSLDWGRSRPDTRDHVDLAFTSPPRQVITDRWRDSGELIDYDQFLVRFQVSPELPGKQVERIVEELRASDPRKQAEVCGGYRAPRRSSVE